MGSKIDDIVDHNQEREEDLVEGDIIGRNLVPAQLKVQQRIPQRQTVIPLRGMAVNFNMGRWFQDTQSWWATLFHTMAILEWSQELDHCVLYSLYQCFTQLFQWVVLEVTLFLTLGMENPVQYTTMAQ